MDAPYRGVSLHHVQLIRGSGGHRESVGV